MEKLLEAQAALGKALLLVSEVIREKLIEEQNTLMEEMAEKSEARYAAAHPYEGNLDDETVED